MPANIARFERLAYLSLALSLLYDCFDGALASAVVLAIGPLLAALPILLIWLTARRRKNWARWIFSILGAIGIAADAWGLFTSAFLTVDFIMICSDIVLVAALYLVWSGGSGDWFRGHLAAGWRGPEASISRGLLKFTLPIAHAGCCETQPRHLRFRGAKTHGP